MGFLRTWFDRWAAKLEESSKRAEDQLEKHWDEQRLKGANKGLLYLITMLDKDGKALPFVYEYKDLKRPDGTPAGSWRVTVEKIDDSPNFTLTPVDK